MVPWDVFIGSMCLFIIMTSVFDSSIIIPASLKPFLLWLIVSRMLCWIFSCGALTTRTSSSTNFADFGMSSGLCVLLWRYCRGLYSRRRPERGQFLYCSRSEICDLCILSIVYITYVACIFIIVFRTHLVNILSIWYISAV